MASGVGEQARGGVSSQLYSNEENAALDMTTSEKVTHWPSLLITEEQH